MGAAVGSCYEAGTGVSHGLSAFSRRMREVFAKDYWDEGISALVAGPDGLALEALAAALDAAVLVSQETPSTPLKVQLHTKLRELDQHA